MPDPRHCPQCGTPLPTGALAGLCPACLLQQGAAADTATQPPAPPFVPPTVEEIAQLFPQLEILGLLGKGGMGAVYKARQPALDRFVALKILPATSGLEAGFAERFAREARALARLSHPHIVTLFEFGSVVGQASRLSPSSANGQVEETPQGAAPEKSETGATPVLLFYFLMEFVDGVNLRQLQRSGRLGPREALQIVPQICDALQYAHDEGVVHRDIKPENVLVDRKGRVKIADFGLAKLVGVAGAKEQSDVSDVSDPSDGATAGTTTLTHAGQVMGTPNYMAPEQAEHPQDVDHRADIYALGVVFYEMLTGELPLGKFPPPSRKVRIDVRLDEVVLHALEKAPERRYQHASEVKTAVETITADAGKSEVRSPKSAGDARIEVLEHRRRRQLWYGFIVALIGLPVGLLLGLPVVWGLALAGIAVGGWKLGLLAKQRNGGDSRREEAQAGQATGTALDPRAPASQPPSLPPPRRRSFGAAALTALAVFLLVTLAATVVTFLLPVSYEGVVRVTFQRNVPEITSAAPPYVTDPSFIQTECEVLRSQGILSRVIQMHDLMKMWDGKFGREKPLSYDEVLTLLRNRIEIHPVRNTAIIEIRAYSEDPWEAVRLANVIPQAYESFRKVVEEDGRPTAHRMQVVSRAGPAQHPSRPNKPLNIALGALAGALLGLLAGGLTLAFPSRGFRTTVLVLAGLPLLVALGLSLVASFSHFHSAASATPRASFGPVVELVSPAQTNRAGAQAAEAQAWKTIPPEAGEIWIPVSALIKSQRKTLKPNDVAAMDAANQEIDLRTQGLTELLRGTVAERLMQQQEAALQQFRAAAAVNDAAGVRTAIEQVDALTEQLDQLLKSAANTNHNSRTR